MKSEVCVKYNPGFDLVNRIFQCILISLYLWTNRLKGFWSSTSFKLRATLKIKALLWLLKLEELIHAFYPSLKFLLLLEQALRENLKAEEAEGPKKSPPEQILTLCRLSNSE